MNGTNRDKYILFSLASVCVIIFVCAAGPLNSEGANGNGMTELEGVISSPAASPNGMVFTLTDLNGNEIRCFYRYDLPGMPVLCRLIGSFSSDGNIFFVDRITADGRW